MSHKDTESTITARFSTLIDHVEGYVLYGVYQLLEYVQYIPLQNGTYCTLSAVNSKFRNDIQGFEEMTPLDPASNLDISNVRMSWQRNAGQHDK